MTPLHRHVPASASFDEEAELRGHEAFMRTLDPAIASAAEWHTRREDGLDSAEEAGFQQWLAADPAHGVAYARLDRSHAELKDLAPASVDHLRVPAGGAGGSPAPQPTGWKKAPAAKPARAGWAWTAAWPAGLAAASILAAAVGIGWYQWHQPTFTAQYATQRGQRIGTSLPDGSEIALDAVARADVALYRNRREARLDEGQAMFIVAADADRPFRVSAGPARITVVGTRFSVRHAGTHERPGAVEVAVEEGKVRIESVLPAPGPDAAPAVLLTPGQSVQVSAAGLVGPVVAVPVSSVALWRKGLVRFSDTPLSQAIHELERYGPTRLVVLDPGIADLRIGGSFDVARPEELARVLPSLLPVKLVPRPDGSREVVRAR